MQVYKNLAISAQLRTALTVPISCRAPCGVGRSRVWACIESWNLPALTLASFSGSTGTHLKSTLNSTSAATSQKMQSAKHTMLLRWTVAPIHLQMEGRSVYLVSVLCHYIPSSAWTDSFYNYGIQGPGPTFLWQWWLWRFCRPCFPGAIRIHTYSNLQVVF